MDETTGDGDMDQPGTAPNGGEAAEQPDTEGHAATIYRRRRGPYPLRNSTLPDEDDRKRSERNGGGRRSAS